MNEILTTGRCLCNLRRRSERGTTVIETLFVVGVVVVGASMAFALVAHWRARTSVEGAARLVLSNVRLARAHAVREGANVALVFRADANGVTAFRMHRDGNGNGVRRAEADRGVDPPVGSLVRLGEHFRGTDFRIPYTLPPIEDGTAVEEGSGAIRLAGGGSVLSCAPTGGATAGTLYVANESGDVFAVRVLGPTGRLRLLEYARGSSTWVERW